MTDLRTAAQQALEALNLVSDEGESKFPGTIQGAISDLEAALAQEQDYWAQEKLRIMEQEHRNSLLRMQQEQAEQTWVCPDSDVHRYAKPGHCEDCGKTLVPVQAEPFTPDAIAHTQAAWKMGYEARRAEEAEPVQEPVGHEALRLAGLALIGLAEHDQHCEVFDVDDEGRHKACTCGLVAAIAVITQAGKTAPPQREPLTEEEIERIRADEREACATRLEAIGCDHCAANIRARSKA